MLGIVHLLVFGVVWVSGGMWEEVGFVWSGLLERCGFSLIFRRYSPPDQTRPPSSHIPPRPCTFGGIGGVWRSDGGVGVD